MAKLGQVVKMLNIGAGTAADFLAQHGEKVEADANVRLSKSRKICSMRALPHPKCSSQ